MEVEEKLRISLDYSDVDDYFNKMNDKTLQKIRQKKKLESSTDDESTDNDVQTNEKISANEFPILEVATSITGDKFVEIII